MVKLSKVFLFGCLICLILALFLIFIYFGKEGVEIGKVKEVENATFLEIEELSIDLSNPEKIICLNIFNNEFSLYEDTQNSILNNSDLVNANQHFFNIMLLGALAHNELHYCEIIKDNLYRNVCLSLTSSGKYLFTSDLEYAQKYVEIILSGNLDFCDNLPFDLISEFDLVNDLDFDVNVEISTCKALINSIDAFENQNAEKCFSLPLDFNEGLFRKVCLAILNNDESYCSE